jgi:hypothetical protein
MKTTSSIFVVGLIALLLAVAAMRFGNRLDQRLAQVDATLAANQTSQTESFAEMNRTMVEQARQLTETRARLVALERQVGEISMRLARAEQALAQRRTVLPGNLTGFVPAELGEDSFLPAKRAWGPEQAIGAPDTPRAGDQSTAWAPRAQDGGEEWLVLTFSNAVAIASVRVRETYNPGALVKITAVQDNGAETLLWEGTEPPSQAPVDMQFPAANTVTARSVKLHLDTRLVAGWNEIDAVAIVGTDGSLQWAAQAVASSSFADR